MAGYPNYDDLYNQIIGGDRDLALTITMDFMILFQGDHKGKNKNLKIKKKYHH